VFRVRMVGTLFIRDGKGNTVKVHHDVTLDGVPPGVGRFTDTWGAANNVEGHARLPIKV